MSSGYSFLYANIRGLLLKSNRCKTAIINDIITENNSIGIALTESWLDDDICDAEVEKFVKF